MGRYALTGGVPSQANLPDRLRNKVTQAAHPGALFKQDNLDWDEIGRLRDQWKGKLVLKGILRPDDAERAVKVGADGIVVSNHGGRGLDGSISSIEALSGGGRGGGQQARSAARQRGAARAATW